MNYFIIINFNIKMKLHAIIYKVNFQIIFLILINGIKMYLAKKIYHKTNKILIYVLIKFKGYNWG